MFYNVHRCILGGYLNKFKQLIIKTYYDVTT